MPTFDSAPDYKRFILAMQYYSIGDEKPKFSMFNPKTTLLNPNNRIVDIVSYCLMPNHFHLLLRQKAEGGITEFIRKLTNSYTKYFNTKHNRVGPLFQGQFKAVHIETNEQLLHINRYIHLNPSVGFIVENLEDYIWSSYKEYIYGQKGICEKEIITQQFNSLESYKNFVLDQEDYGKTLEFIKHQLIDLEL